MLEVREDTFSGNKNDDAHEHVEVFLDIVSLFNIPGVSHDAVMLRVFPITLIGAAKRWVDRLPPGTVNSWDLLKKPLSKGNKVNIFYNGLGTMNRQLLDSQGPILGMTHAQALTIIRTMADHSQKWHDGTSSKNIESSSNSEGITAIVSKLDNVGRDMKNLKENVHAIQVGCQICRGAHLDKDFPLNEEVKSVEEVKYGEIEEASKRHVVQDEWLKKFYHSTKTSREAHDKIIQGIETKVKTLANEVEGRVNNGKFEEFKTICTEDGSPLYTPFYYSPEEIEYFSSNSGFSNNEKQETDNSGMTKALAALEATLKIKKEEPKEEKQTVNYYVDPYEPPIPFFRRLEHHAEEALDLVENKPRTEEDREIRMNPTCSALLQNHLPLKEQDPGSFILPCSIGKLDFNNALADLGASISVMPLSMYKHLGIGKLKPINMVIEMADNTKCTPKGIVENLLIKIDKFIFLVDFVIFDMVEDLKMPIILGRPFLATVYAKVDIFRKSISLEVGSEKVIFKMRSSFTMTFEFVRLIRSDTCPEDDDFKKIDYDLVLYD
ncbi:protein kinase-like domain, concanavalin A-like lectin/glucanase domain protein [Tanacetum coccineum]